MPELDDLMAEIPEGILSGEEIEAEEPVVEDEEVVEDPAEDESDDESDDDKDIDDKDPAEDEDDDYVVQAGNEKTETPEAPANAPKAIEGSEGQYILDHLQKINVRIINAKDEVETIQVYGWGDLPKDYKGFPTPYEQGVFTGSVQSQEAEARKFQSEYQQNRIAVEQEQYSAKENKAIADDLIELRQEGVFPKFKGTPGSREFNNSEGAKEFDRVTDYMNEYNDKALETANKGAAYKHIGFKEAYTMLHGPNPKAAANKTQQARKAVASRTVSGRGANASSRTPSAPVTNIMDLQADWDQMVGSTK